MGIKPYLREIGRGSEGARSLTRDQAQDLMGQLLDDQCSDVEIGAFCLAMRIKGESPEEMAGFLDAIESRIQRVPPSGHPVVVLPSYNGARKLPVLTPLLGLLLARRGLPVLIHGTATEDTRVTTQAVLAEMGIAAQSPSDAIAPGRMHFVPTESLHLALKRLLDLRRILGLRNSLHSLVKLMNPVDGAALVVSSYTHPEYAVSMADTFRLRQSNALLLRGTEGEPVADPRRTPTMQLFVGGVAEEVQAARTGPLASLPSLPTTIDPASTVHHIRQVLEGRVPLPEPIGLQIDHIVRACKAVDSANDPSVLAPLTTA